MKFTNGIIIVYVYPEQKKLFLNGEISEMQDIAIFTQDRAKFSFGQYDVKILGDRMSIFSRVSRLLMFSLTREDSVPDSPISNSNSSEKKFIISKGKYVSLVNDSAVLYEGKEYEVIKTSKYGSRNVYTTSIGDLVVSEDDQYRRSSWLGIYIETI